MYVDHGLTGTHRERPGASRAQAMDRVAGALPDVLSNQRARQRLIGT
jgi:hypothetical protein